MLANFFRHFKTHWWFTIFLIMIVFVLILFGGYGIFYFLFRFLENQEVFGPLMVNLLVNMVNLIFFTMLVFSNLIILLSSAYLSPETERLFSFPLRGEKIFLMKFMETQFFSSWGFLILSIPMYLALFQVRNIAPFHIFFLFPPLFFYIFIPTALASLVILLLTFIVPPKQTQKLMIFLVLAGIFISVVVYRFLGVRELIRTSLFGDFTQLVNFLNLGLNPLLPNSWYSKSIYSLMRADWTSYLFYTWILFINATFFTSFIYFLSSKVFRPGWLKTQEHNLTSKNQALSVIFNFRSRNALSTLIMKDLIIFFRDPSQWMHILLFLGLVFAYLFNLGRLPQADNLPYWNEIIVCFNIAAANFILAIITTRFIFPQISLEGQQFWILCTAPIKKTLIIWQKLFSGLFVTFTFAIIISTVSNWILRTTLPVKILSMATLLSLSVGLTVISICIGTVTANFKETNAAKIANGSGGTLNVIVSLIYLAANLFLLIRGIFLYLTSGIPMYMNHYLWLLFLGNVAFIGGFLTYTLKRWKYTEI